MRKHLKNIIITCILVSVIVPIIDYLFESLNGKDVSILIFLLNIFGTLIITATLTTANLFVFEFYHRKFPRKENFWKRITLELLGTAVIATVATSVLYLPMLYLSRLTGANVNDPRFSFVNTLGGVNLVSLIVSLFYEAYFMFEAWKRALIESEKMKREAAEAQYAALRNQVNPHFLFNNLNSLSSLIRMSPEKAIDFVDRFSKIYRYVLDVSDKIVVHLSEEISFLQSYCFLQQTRFGDNLIINTNIDASKLNDYMVPLSIQLLIENVTKHNEVSSEFPMKIDIYCENDFLVIKNKLQKKDHFANKLDNHGIGLATLTERYKHITELEPKFYVEDNHYIAKIPLLKEAL
jgi:sensor histidine kinase YesM